LLIYRDICDFFKDGGRSHLGFSKIRNFNGSALKGEICITVPNFIKIGQTVAERWRFNGFSKMAAVRHLEFAGRVLGPLAMTTWWSLSLCKIWLKSME